LDAVSGSKHAIKPQTENPLESLQWPAGRGTKHHAVVANKIIHRFISDYTLLTITNKMQRYTIFFVTVNALYVSGGFSAHHQELKNCTHSMGYMPSLLAATASVGVLELTHASS
jgi:hypothetical protein